MNCNLSLLSNFVLEEYEEINNQEAGQIFPNTFLEACVCTGSEWSNASATTRHN